MIIAVSSSSLGTPIRHQVTAKPTASLVFDGGFTMVQPVFRTMWCALGGVTGLVFAVYLGAGSQPIHYYVNRQFGDIMYSLLNREMDLGLFVTGILAGAILGLLIGAYGVRSPLTAVGAFAWVCGWTAIGIAAGGGFARSGIYEALHRPSPDHPLTALGWDMDAVLREIEWRPWGGLAGAIVGYGLFACLRSRLSSKAALLAENERLRDEVAQLKQRRA